MLNAYNLQIITKLEKDTEVSPKTSPLINSGEVSPLFSFTTDTTVSPKDAGRSKLEIEKSKTKKEIFDISCHEIRNFLFGITGMISLLTKNNTAYREILDSTAGKAIKTNLREEIMKTVVFINTQINILNSFAAQQRIVVSDILNSPKSQDTPTPSIMGSMNANSLGDKANQILNAKSGINNIVNELKKVNAKLDALLNSPEGLELEMNIRNELVSLIEADKRSIYILDVCVEDQDELVGSLGITHSFNAKKNNFLIQPKKIITEIADILKNKLEEKKLKLELNLPMEDIVIEANPANLRRILINLVSNAIKFTANTESKPGVIKINFVNSSINSNESTLIFSVEDNGIGIKKNEQAHIFKPYQQANSEIVKTYGGTGLGLSSIKELVETMRGEIKCESTENVGSKFTFSVKCPVLSNPSSRPSSPLIFSTPVPANKGKHVLIVDDQIINRKLLQNFLSKAGYTFDVAKNGKEAVELCENSKFDIILMDIIMPGMDGLEATQIIRQSLATKVAGNQEVPIIALSGNDNSGDIQKSKEIGMNDYLVKGHEFNQSLLIEKIKHLCSKNTSVALDKENKNSSPIKWMKI